MPSEHEAAEETRRLSRPPPGAPTQQCEQRDARQQGVCDDVRLTMDVTTRSHYVHRESDDQQAGRGDVRSLKVPVAWPKPPADTRAGWHGKEEHSEQCQDAGDFVTRGGQLEMLNDAVISAEQQSDVENRGAECQPAQKLVTAQREGMGGAGPWPNRQHAQHEASGNRAETRGLRHLPGCRERRHKKRASLYCRHAGAASFIVRSMNAGPMHAARLLERQ